MFSKNRKIELLKSVPLFSGCSKKELERIATIADEIDFKPGKTLIREGAPGREFFVLAEGTAEITRNGEKIDTAGAGDFFGEMALLSGRPRQADVVALGYCQLLALSAADFRRFLRTHSAAKAEIDKVVAARTLMNEEAARQSPTNAR